MNDGAGRRGTTQAHGAGYEPVRARESEAEVIAESADTGDPGLDTTLEDVALEPGTQMEPGTGIGTDPEAEVRAKVEDGSPDKTRTRRKKATDTITDYLDREFSTFLEKPLNRIDSLILTEFSYIRWEDSPLAPTDLDMVSPPRLKDLFRAEDFNKIFDIGRFKHNHRSLLGRIASSPRFRDVMMLSHTALFEESVDRQFSATTFLLPDNSVYIAYRGTDMSIVGWKEDFMLAFTREIPSQRSALDYLEDIARIVPGKLYVGGHSKGGNLAVYAAANCNKDTRGRIIRIFSHDGPGFCSAALEDFSLAAVEDLVDKTVPESSMIGMLLEQTDDYTIVRANKTGFDQHDGFNWLIDGDDFALGDTISRSATLFNAAMAEFIESLTYDQREMFVDALFSLFASSGAQTFEEMKAADLAAMGSHLMKMDPDSRKRFLDLIGEYLQISFSTLLPTRG